MERQVRRESLEPRVHLEVLAKLEHQSRGLLVGPASWAPLVSEACQACLAILESAESEAKWACRAQQALRDRRG